MKRECTRCKKEKSLEDFRFRNKTKGTRQSWCKECMSKWEKNIWKTSKQRRSSNAKKAALRRKRNVDFVIDYLKDKKCLDCGEDDIVVLEFDHISDKKFEISYATRATYSLEKIKQEIDKCDIVCANCHKRRTAKQFNWRKNS